MKHFLEALLENADSKDFNLKNIDPRGKAYNAEDDDEFYKEAYSKASIVMNDMYKKTIELFNEIRVNIGCTNNKCPINIENDTRVVASLYTLSLNPCINSPFLAETKKCLNFTGDIESEEGMDAVDFAFYKFKNDMNNKFIPCNEEFRLVDFMGKRIRGEISFLMASKNLHKICNQLTLLGDELYSVYEYFTNLMLEKKNPSDIELIARAFEYIIKLSNSYASAYMMSALELCRILDSNNKPFNESAGASNEENAKQYVDEIDKLVSEIRDFYDKFEYKEVITPRKKKEPKMYEYVLGALERKYTLRVPMYKVVGKSADVKDIVENKFISKLKSITKKYPNFCILSPEWDKEDDMFIYITLREPFGEKDDRSDREDQTKAMQEASMTTAERKALANEEFGLPNDRKYPLNDETHIREAINKFGFCKPEFKKELSSNIVKRALLLGLFDKVYVSDKHPNKSFFPEWFIGKTSEKGFTLDVNGNKYTIKDSQGKKVDWYTINKIEPINESIIFDSEGKLY